MENIFSFNISFLRKQKGLSQGKLGEVLGLKATSISNWEKGVSHPDYNTLQAILNFFEIEPNKLMLSKLNEENCTFPISSEKNAHLICTPNSTPNTKNEKLGVQNEENSNFQVNEDYEEYRTAYKSIEPLQNELKELKTEVAALKKELIYKEEVINTLKDHVNTLKSIKFQSQAMSLLEATA